MHPAAAHPSHGHHRRCLHRHFASQMPKHPAAAKSSRDHHSWVFSKGSKPISIVSRFDPRANRSIVSRPKPPLIVNRYRLAGIWASPNRSIVVTLYNAWEIH